MIYAKEITVPSQTPKDDPIEVTFHLEGVAITQFQLLVPPGHAGLTGLAIFYGIEQIAPLPTGEWFVSDNEVITWPEYFPIPQLECDLTIKAYNEDDSYDHSFYLRAVVMGMAEYLREIGGPYYFEEE